MKNSWLIWLFIVGVVVTVLVAFNYQGSKNTVPLSEIFPEEKTVPVDIAYEFVDENAQTMTPLPAATPAGDITSAPVKTEPAKPAVTAQAPVEAKPQTAAAPAAAVQTQIKPGVFTIQIASYKTKDAADLGLKKVQEKGYSGYVVSKDLGAKGTWHRVYVGAFQSKPEAEQELTKIKSDYPSSFIISSK